MIQLTRDLWMDADEHCYIVGKPRQSADKVVRLDKPTYYTTAAQAVSGACARALLPHWIAEKPAKTRWRHVHPLRWVITYPRPGRPKRRRRL